jgi:hypothetical protein
VAGPVTLWLRETVKLWLCFRDGGLRPARTGCESTELMELARDRALRCPETRESSEDRELRRPWW